MAGSVAARLETSLARKRTSPRLPPPYLKKILVDGDKLAGRQGYPYDLPWIKDGAFELEFTTPVTIIVGENGVGKSTLIESIAALAGYDEAGGGKGYRAVDHSRALDVSGSRLAECLKAHWLPRVTEGWFFRAESFFSVARYLDSTALEWGGMPPDFLSHSHGEGFLRFFAERCQRRGLYIMDEPESALSPRRQLDLMRLLQNINEAAQAQVVIATHSPLLMALSCARLLQLSHRGLEETDYRWTDHFRLYREFTTDPKTFVSSTLAETIE